MIADRTDAIEDHLAALEVAVAQMREPTIVIGEEALIRADLNLSVSQSFPDVSCSVGLGACHLRLDVVDAEIPRRDPDVPRHELDCPANASIKRRGKGNRPFWLFEAAEGCVLDFDLCDILDRVVGIQPKATVTATLSAWIKDAEPTATSPKDSLRDEDAGFLDPDARTRVVARLQAIGASSGTVIALS